MFPILVQLLLINLSHCQEQEVVSSSATNILSSKQEDTVHMDLERTNYRAGRFLISFTEYNTTTSTISTSWWCWTTDAANPPTTTCSKRKRRRAELIETIGGGEAEGGRYISPSKPIGSSPMNAALPHRSSRLLFGLWTTTLTSTELATSYTTTMTITLSGCTPGGAFMYSVCTAAG
eukprot:TRINITY_DN27842_c0_g1_i1.p1 TRINITY_DN27842_c0_g1~~TRINITY_DN27842_c0_g1_i1.p1  ORF type:complete len:177 (-),score=39.92 TRINITY_DN27842_c0_g1_i1:57-587(-)